MKKNLLERLQREGNPLIDDGRVTFLWNGDSAPQLLDDLHNWDEHPQKFERIAPGLWAVSFALTADSYLEYSLRDPLSGAAIRDPFNKNRISNGIGGHNHFFYMPEAGSTPLIKPAEKKFRGTVTRHKVDTGALGGNKTRTVYLYHPAVRAMTPLLLVYDGMDYLRRGKINHIVDNLIAQKRIRPISMALLHNGGDSRRFVEYNGSDTTLLWLMKNILPFAKQNLRLTNERGGFGALGASLGGLMSMYTGLRLPEIFGKIICQSGVFEFNGLDCSVVDLIRHAPKPDVKIWMGVGKMEELLEDNRRILPIFSAKNYDVSYHEFGGGHNFTSWRNSLGNALEKMFG